MGGRESMDDTSKILMIVLFVVWFIVVIPFCFYCKKKGYCPERAGGGYSGGGGIGGDGGGGDGGGGGGGDGGGC